MSIYIQNSRRSRRWGDGGGSGGRGGRHTYWPGEEKEDTLSIAFWGCKTSIYHPEKENEEEEDKQEEGEEEVILTITYWGCRHPSTVLATSGTKYRHNLLLYQTLFHNIHCCFTVAPICYCWSVCCPLSINLTKEMFWFTTINSYCQKSTMNYVSS